MGPGCLSGYRSMWHTLRREGYQLSRQAVATCLQEMDTEGCERRRRRKLKRRVYTNPGPNYCWHIDGYDKLKPDGFPVHGCIDGHGLLFVLSNLNHITLRLQPSIQPWTENPSGFNLSYPSIYANSIPQYATCSCSPINSQAHVTPAVF